MLSFNHYAYGAVLDWIYRYVAGIAPTRERPGYRRVIVAPRPATAITWAKASVESRLGPVSIDWRLDGGDLEIALEVPYGAEAELDLPLTDASTVSLDGEPYAGGLIGPGGHRIVVTAARVADPARARSGGTLTHGACRSLAPTQVGRDRHAPPRRVRHHERGDAEQQDDGRSELERELQARRGGEHPEPERGDRLHEVAHDVGGRDHGGAVVGGCARRDEAEPAREHEAVARAGHERRRDERRQRVVEPGDDEQAEADDREHRPERDGRARAERSGDAPPPRRSSRPRAR